MVFTPPKWARLSADEARIPDSISVAEFLEKEGYGRCPFAQARNPFTCALTGKTYTAAEVMKREDYLSRALSKRLGMGRQGTEWDRVVALFSYNTVDYIPLTHAVHRVNGIVTPASPYLTVSELQSQLRSSGAKALVTCSQLLDSALEAALQVGIPREHVFILPLAGDPHNLSLTTTEELITEGSLLPPLPPKKWPKGQGTRQIAYLCYSSGTSGLPKAVAVTHLNVIAGVIQQQQYEAAYRKQNGIANQVLLGVLPFSHIYGLIAIAHLGSYCGDEVVVLPKYSLTSFLRTIQDFQVEEVTVVPPILVQMLSDKKACQSFDLSSIRCVRTRAAPLASETVQGLLSRHKDWHICQAYGLTEATSVITQTSEADIFPGSSGSLLPLTRAKVVDSSGKEVVTYGTAGEMLVQGPGIVPGYLNNERATVESFFWDGDGCWLKTGDEVMVKLSPKGNEHFFIVDRIKELIKVKGSQVAPAELEAHILDHDSVSDCAVVAVPHHRTGEAPKAYVVRSNEAAPRPETETAQAIVKHVEKHKSRHKWLAGGVEFVDVIPKSASGKILRRVLRDKERAKQREKTSIEKSKL